MVVAKKDISGGLLSDGVEKGTEGIVVEAPFMGDAVVLFKVKGFWNDREVRLTVGDSDVF